MIKNRIETNNTRLYCPNCFNPDGKIESKSFLCNECEKIFPLKVVELIKQKAKKIKGDQCERLVNNLLNSKNLKEFIEILECY